MVTDLRLSIADCWLPIADCRPRIAGRVGIRASCLESEIWDLKSEMPRAGGECQAQAPAPSPLSLWQEARPPNFPVRTTHERCNRDCRLLIYRLPIVDCCLTIADSWLPTVHCRLSPTNYCSPVPDCGLSPTDYSSPIRIADCRRPTTARPFPTADYRPRIADQVRNRASYLESEIWNLESEMPRAGSERQAQAPAPGPLSLSKVQTPVFRIRSSSKDSGVPPVSAPGPR